MLNMNSMIALVFKWVSSYILEQRETECVFILFMSALIAIAILRIKRTMKLLDTRKDELLSPAFWRD